MKRVALALFLLAAPLAAAPVVVCSASTGRVVTYDASANTPQYAGNTQAIVSPPSLATLAAVPVHHWQCVGSAGAWTDVREMTQGEKDALAAEQAAAEEVALYSSSCGSFSGQTEIGLTLRSLVDALVDEINVLRALYPLPVASITRSGTTATVTTRWAHGLTGTPQVTISGATAAAYNGTVTIAVTGATTFTYTGVSGNPTTPAAGSITAYPASQAPQPRTLSGAKTTLCNTINNGEVDE